MAEDFRLLGCRGCGSFIVEAAFRIAGIPYDREEVDYDEPGPARDRLFSLNPLGQVPTLIMPDGSIMTESAAIVFMIDDKVPEAGLVPPAGSAERNSFLRWLVFIVAAIYPTHTYGDDPKKWLPGVADPTGAARKHGPASREALAAGRGQHRAAAVVPRHALLRARHLCRRDDALAPAPGMVCEGMPEARRRSRRRCSACRCSRRCFASSSANGAVRVPRTRAADAAPTRPRTATSPGRCRGSPRRRGR